ncbi:MAG: hypothetical protein NC453_11825 [Muribaculum sp.]|nr:hypothetical protein [Muribaculum sp.]
MADNEFTIPKIRILRKTYESLQSWPLFFFNAVEEYDYQSRQTYYYWEPEAIYFEDAKDNRIHREDGDSSTRDTLFCFGYLTEEQSAVSDYVEMSLTEFNPNDKTHVRAVFMLYLNKAYNTTDAYSFREFLWMLNRYLIKIDVISEVLAEFDAQTIQPFFLQALKNFAICLSIPKQKIIQQFLLSKGVETNIYCPQLLTEAVSKCFPSIDIEKVNIPIHHLINLAVVGEEYRQVQSAYNCLTDNSITNFLLKVRRWLKDGNYVLEDFSSLINFIRLFSPTVQLRVVKRYFHAIRKGQTEFNTEILSKFQKSPYENWGIYFHCSFEPAKPVRLAVPLLCDNILTFLNRGQQTLQTINGTLDLAYARCDSNTPNVDFGLSGIVPMCKGGAAPDTYKFKGFICYEDVVTLNKSKIKSDEILLGAKALLNYLGNQQKREACHSEETTLQTCSNRNVNIYACTNCDMRGIEWLDKWNIWIPEKQESKAEVLKIFIDKAFPLQQHIEVSIDEVITDPAIFKSRLISWLDQHLTKVPSTSSKKKDGATISLDAGWILKDNIAYHAVQVVNKFLKHSWFKVEPRKDTYIGRGVLFPILGISEENNGIIIQNPYDREDIKRQENKYVIEKITSALTEKLDVQPHSDGAFYVPYNQRLLREIKSEFYTQKQEANSSTFSRTDAPFLGVVKSKYDRYCAPKYDDDVNLVTGLRFFWCRGKECFKNSLANQTLESVKTWQDYTILHMLEILGYPQVAKTPGGNEASELIRSFIGMVNKAASLFKRVRCRECNHLLFPIGGSQFNRYNNFECHVPTCGQRGIRVYLSQCHNCKSELIDSRDSARCPNGWHICPKCLSCCNDSVYERQASKYIVRHNPVPPRIAEKLGHGHNDKGEYFCAKCGGPVYTVRDENSDRVAKRCQSCGTMYEDLPEQF